MQDFDPIEPDGPLSGLRVGAVLVGFIVDNVATALAGILIYFLILLRVGWNLEGEIPEEALESASDSAEFLVSMAIVGTLCTVLGGYVASRRAARFYVRHGAFVGIADILLGLVLLAVSPPEPSWLWFDLLGFIVVVPAGATGGYLAKRRERAA